MDFILFPTEAADRILVEIELPAGTSLLATEEKVMEINKIVTELPEEELETFISRIGQSSSILKCPSTAPVTSKGVVIS